MQGLSRQSVHIHGLHKASTSSRGSTALLARHHLLCRSTTTTRNAALHRRSIAVTGQATFENKGNRSIHISPVGTCDVVLSSGFLGFANHCGFLQAVEQQGVNIGGIMGTSAGALTGSLYAAGYSPREVLHLLCKSSPLEWLSRPDGHSVGVMSLRPVIDRLSELLPATFEELDIEFAVGVVQNNGLGRTGEYKIIDSGSLPEAVAASAAIPFLFNAVNIPGQEGRFMDGGKFDRVGLRGWRARRQRQEGRAPPALVHVIERSSKFSGDDDTNALLAVHKDVLFVNSPKSGRSLLSVGAYEKDFDSVVLRVERELRTTFPAFISGNAEILTGPVVSPRQSKLTESKADAGSLAETSRWEA